MPAELTLEIRGANELKAMLAAQRNQLPYAMSLGLNTLVGEAQGAIKQGLAGRFRLRREAFIKQTVYRRKGTWPTGDFSSKTALTAAVRINPARDVLAKHEDAGTKTPRGGHRLAIPTIRLNQPNLVIGRGNRYNLASLPVIPGASATQIRRVKRKSGVAYRATGVTFYATRTRKAGATIIWEARGAGTPPRAIWMLRPGGVPLAPRLGFQQTAQGVIDQRWEAVLGAAIDRALATAK